MAVYCEYLLIGLLHAVLDRFGCGEQGMVASAERGLEPRPNSMNGTGHRSTLFDIAHTLTMQDVFKFTTKFRAPERFRQEESFHDFIPEFLANLLKRFLTVNKVFENVLNGGLCVLKFG